MHKGKKANIVTFANTLKMIIIEIWKKKKESLVPKMCGRYSPDISQAHSGTTNNDTIINRL